MNIKSISAIIDSLVSRSHKIGCSAGVSEAEKIAKAVINLNADPKAIAGASSITLPAWKKLQPVKFIATNFDNYAPVPGYYEPVSYKFIQKQEIGPYQKFNPELSPRILEIVKKPCFGADLENLAYPSGSIAMASGLSEAISTSEMWQCCAASFASKKDNVQVLLHLCPTVDVESNKDLIRYIINNLPKDNIEMSVVPGLYADTDHTISFLVDAVRNLNSKIKINFCDFPPNYRRVILQNGELKCIDNKMFAILATNPIDRIMYATI